MYFSIIIPIYNRPEEIDELLKTLTKQLYKDAFEVVIVEDGSTITCEHIIAKYKSELNISYYYKENSGPGDSRNFGMQHAKGDYFIIFDSDCLIPEQYLSQVATFLQKNFVHCYGGPDAAHEGFSDIQKAINHSMTSFLTTGGIRGGSEKIDKFQPRSFNMGISKHAFLETNGFGMIHPGEDPDLSIRLWNLGYNTALIPSAYVYHKRRIDFKKFYKQVNKFGKARPILNYWYPKYTKLTYWFPVCYLLQLLLSLFLTIFGVKIFLIFNLFYLFLVFLNACVTYNSLKIGVLSILTTLIQFVGYALGFLKSYYRIFVLKRDPKKAMPEMFF